MKHSKSIKSSKLSLKFANTNKSLAIGNFIENYHQLVSDYVEVLWDLEKIPLLVPKELTSSVSTTLSARIQQCASKQASGIVRGTRKKQEQMMWRLKKLEEEGKFKYARKLKEKLNKTRISKPIVKNLECELDERFVRIDFENSTSFDGWITISSIGSRQKIVVPVKKTKHFNALLDNSERLLKGIRLSKEKITFNFELKQKESKIVGSTLGIDIGSSSVISCSNGFQSVENSHGYNLQKINRILSRKKKGSKSFQKTQQHRKNYINWSINQLNLDDVKTVKIEKIKNLRKNRKSSRFLSHWTYTEIFEKLESHCNNSGVQIETIDPTYTSQRCSNCGRVRKANRKGKWFKCDSCGHSQDSDLNASLNISFTLPRVPKEVRLMSLNRKGFYWLESGFYYDSSGSEPIVPNALKTKSN